eukprot:TRINITY_DN7282_c0_g1_i1.p1 TRINITY_DN7282_c0_g1~~TRINITY_DN7282_c0_g1_i1.p1  ORF type:complete len:149 (-),score=49.65 TRINITY_DN7282_c0_g1_i1:438-827(-)
MKDKAEAEREDALKSLHVVEQRLAEKVTMYNDFVQGKSLDVAELNKGGYLVDFEQKRWDQPANEPELIHPDMERERMRREWERLAREREAEDLREREKRARDRMLLNQIVQETQEGREQISKLSEERYS